MIGAFLASKRNGELDEEVDDDEVDDDEVDEEAEEPDGA